MEELPRHAFLDPRLYNVSQVGPSLSAKIDPDQVRQNVDNWLAEKGKFQLNSVFYNKRLPPQNEISISAAKQSLRNCLETLKKMTQMQEDLRGRAEVMSSQEWKQKTSALGGIKEEFDKVIAPFEDSRVLSVLKGALKTRAKKRFNQKRRKKWRQEMAKEEKEKQAERHKAIDSWLQSKKEEVGRAKMEEKMRKDADCVLYEVTKKKSEARKQLSLISALVKLRTVRDHMATQRGEKPCLEDRQAFGCVTEKLIRMWENAFQVYTKEEQCLKIMLETNASKDTHAAVQGKQTRIVNTWQTLLFGVDGPEVLGNPTFWALTSAERDFESFVAIRKSWDTFVNIKGTSIPLGWVVPTKRNTNWESYLN